ncbi:probable methyltransferase At1g29790 [Cornus florida]|uniref:probable methyltransferase At1g29790 n=1 Tax=Cornus florida TaxID=4283 RepID=UPI00289FC2B6|nr:probable methyltransferase At1g29790 [Cornus florida]
MGSGGGAENYSPKKKPPLQHSPAKYKLKMLLLVILTNLVTIYIFTGPFLNTQPISKYTQHLSLPLWDTTATTLLHHQLNSTTHQLAASHSQISDLQQQLKSTNLLIDALLNELTHLHNPTPTSPTNFNYDNAVMSTLPKEVRLAIGPHKLPLGYSPRMGSGEVYPPFGGGCLMLQSELQQYMSYDIGGECPVDDVFAQRLMLKGCEPLPRRRCHPKSPAGYVEPNPLPESLWTTPPDSSIIWDPYTCKDYKCLIDRKNVAGYFDCKDCFDLQSREKSRWLFDNGGLDYAIDRILGEKPPGTIRIGLDIGGGTGTFAARMKERNVTIITSSMNLDGPFNSFIASRGLISMHVSVSQRLPFFENTLDIVHSMHVLSNWIPDTMLEFTLYDIYRVLRPGGLFWLDHFFCLGSQLNETYVPMLDRVGFKKIRWNAGMKMDRGVEKNEWYFSALLEKPMT